MAIAIAVQKNDDFEVYDKNGKPFYPIPVLKEYKTYDECLEAVKNYKHIHTLHEYFNNYEHSNPPIKHIPAHWKTAEICKISVRSFAMAIEYVPDNLKTAKLCTNAVKKEGFALKYVPDNLKTEALCLIAVKEYGGALNLSRNRLERRNYALKQ